MRKAAQAATPAKATGPTREDKIDEYGELKRQESLWAPGAARLKALREEINSWYASAPADQSITAHGKLYILTISARENERSIVSMARVFTHVGRAAFLRLCRFPLAACDELNIPADLIESARTGPRTIAAVPKTPSKAA